METAHKADWPIMRMHQIMKYQIEICCGMHDGAEPLSDYVRIPLGSSIDFGESMLTHLILSSPVDMPKNFRQDSGSADFFLMSGITECERNFAKEQGSDALIKVLREETEFPVTNPIRESAKP